MDNSSISNDIGTVHDISEFDFLADIEDYYFKQLNHEIEVEILQGKSSTEGSLNLKIIFKNGVTKIFNDDESFELINKV